MASLGKTDIRKDWAWHDGDGELRVCLYSVPLIIMEAELLDVQHKMEKQDVAS
jgi:hypothetical protein